MSLRPSHRTVIRHAARLISLSTMLALAVVALPAAAQYPSRPVRLVVPFPPGGASDAAARTIGQALSRSLGQPVTIENRPGANGAVAAQAVVGASPDGHTLMWGVGSMTALPLLMKQPPFDSLARLSPVAMVGRLTFAMFVNVDVPATTAGELARYARANPDKLAFASATISEHLAAAQFMKSTGSSMVKVAYKGGAQALPDLVAGRVQVYFTPISPGLPHVKEGRLRQLATLLAQRSPAAPDVPTIAEAGVAGVSVPTWQAVFAPPNTPRDIVDRLATDIARAQQDPDVRAQFDRLLLLVERSTPESLATLIGEEQRAWAQFTHDNGIVAE